SRATPASITAPTHIRSLRHRFPTRTSFCMALSSVLPVLPPMVQTVHDDHRAHQFSPVGFHVALGHLSEVVLDLGEADSPIDELVEHEPPIQITPREPGAVFPGTGAAVAGANDTLFAHE